MILALLIFLGCVLGFTLLTYAIYLYERGKQPGWEPRFYQISSGALRGYLVESLCTAVLLLLWFCDFVWSVVRWLPWPGREGRTSLRSGDRPVILCHGYHVRGLTLGVLALSLRRMGRSKVTMPTFGPSTAAIRHYAEQLTEHIREVLRDTGAEAVDIVGHSMGGLVARACVAQAQRSGDSSLRVAHLITLGTPHKGVDMWVFTWGDCGLDLKTGSPFLRWLGEDPRDVKATVIYSPFDAMVLEESASGWNAPRVRKVHLDGAGHIALSMLPRAAREVFEAMRS
ncbi:MAG: esterase/lipase family protein [Nitrospinota bacterium]